MSPANPDQVSAILHTLRGEAFRHQLNLAGNKQRRLPAISRGPSLPPSLYSSEAFPRINKLSVSNPSSIPGPPPPRSWAVFSPSKSTDPTSPEWRSNALSFILKRTPRSSRFYHDYSSTIPSFFNICLGVILAKFGGIPSDMYRDIPRHVLREYVRYSVISRVLPKEELLQIWKLDNMNSVDGELLVTGSVTTLALSKNMGPINSFVEDWDAEDNQYEGRPDIVLSPMHTFIALSASFNYSYILLLPTSVTHLALLNIQKLPLHFLPTQLPSLIVLDLSYNLWINNADILLIEWNKWTDLEAVGLRGCMMDEKDVKIVTQEIRKGRLLDVEIVVE
ncbi:hypothetical protein Clacol_010283 [Clathrus columnatus]|uniref:Uncharacterized protein n=1 Tax=Clathrus columnatus TaxID=1419009 RepID=A0AAV5AN21_9AGAM|nr:hypothetical protein Clacol_010283 [Clathrus columnatus]